MIPRATVSVKGSRSQSALEYMMTYGWAILIIVIVAGVLYSLGIFNPSSSAGTTVTGFSGLGSVSATCLSNGAFELSLGNNVGLTINITRINVTNQNGAASVVNFTSAVINQNQLVNLLAPSICTSGASSLTVQVKYSEPDQVFPGPYFSSGQIKTSAVATDFNPTYTLNIAGVQQGNYVPPYANASLPLNFSSITLSAWEYNNGTGNYWQNIFEVFNSSSLGMLDIGVTDPSGAPVIRWDVKNLVQPGGPVQTAQKWILITGTWNSVTNNLTLYVNGVQINSATGDGTLLAKVTGLNVGGGYEGMSSFIGRISDIQIYDTALSLSQITALYNEGFDGVPISSSNLVAWLPLDGNGMDYSGNNYNVKLYGAGIGFST